MKNKKLLGVLGVAALLLAGNFALQEREVVDAASGTTIYFKPNSNWSQANAKFDAWTWGGSSADSWVDFTDSDGDGIYEALLATGRTGMKIVRRGPSQTSHSWDGGQKWNETGDITIPTNGNNLWTQTSGTWNGTGSWSSYTPPVGYVGNVLTLTGSMQGWNPADENYKFTDENEDHVYNYSLELAPGQHKFKIVKDLNWGTEWGYTALTKKGVPLTNDTDDNCVLTTLGGTYDFEFDFASKTLTVTQTSNYSINQVMSHFYNAGSYTKVSDIFVNEEVERDISQYFHTGNIAELHRTTVYSDGRLLMTTEKDTNGVGYKTVGEDMVRFHVVNGQDVNDYTVKGTSVEAYYVTLADFLLASSTSHYGTLDMLSGWTYADGIYSNSSADVLDAFRLFTAPMWVGKTAETENYIIFSKATVEVVDGDLVMKLWAVGEEGKLTNTDGLFSQAVISLN